MKDIVGFDLRMVDYSTFLIAKVDPDITMTQMPANYAASPTDDNKVIVSVGNVLQNPTVQYQLNGNQITFTSEPPFGQTIVVLHGFASTNPL